MFATITPVLTAMNQTVIPDTEGFARLVVGLKFKAYLITMEWDYVQWVRTEAGWRFDEKLQAGGPPS